MYWNCEEVSHVMSDSNSPFRPVSIRLHLYRINQIPPLQHHSRDILVVAYVNSEDISLSYNPDPLNSSPPSPIFNKSSYIANSQMQYLSRHVHISKTDRRPQPNAQFCPRLSSPDIDPATVSSPKTFDAAMNLWLQI